jgi:uncharacterized integral membrane protein
MSSDPLVPKDPNLEPLPPKPLEPLDPSVNDPVLDTKDTKPVKPRDEAGQFTRAGALWTALIIGFLILIVLLVFIMQNMDYTTVHLFAWSWQAPVGVALLLGAIAGGLLTFLVGTARILQLRRAAKKNLKAGF